MVLRSYFSAYVALQSNTLSANLLCGVCKNCSKTPKPYRAAIAAKTDTQPAITLAELTGWLEETQGVRVALSTLDYFIRKVLHYPYKKNGERDDLKAARVLWKHWQKTCDPSKLVFLDETGTSTDMARRYGLSAKGTRCIDTVPGGHWETLTFIAGLSVNEITAPWVLDAAMSGEAFKTYLKTQLAPTLQPDDIVIYDNLPAH